MDETDVEHLVQVFEYATASRQTIGGWRLSPRAFLDVGPENDLADVMTVASQEGWAYVDHSRTGYFTPEGYPAEETLVIFRRLWVES